MRSFMRLVLNALSIKVEFHMEGACISTRDAGLCGTAMLDFCRQWRVTTTLGCISDHVS